MGKPVTPVVIYTIIYLYGIYNSQKDRANVFYSLLIWCIVSLIIYIFGVNYFYDLVKSSSSHGNTIHGWYSKYNSTEQALGNIWIYGFPIISTILALFIGFQVNRLFKNKL